MSPFDWARIVEVLLAGGVIGVIANLWVNRRKPEVDRGTLDIARAKNASDIYTADLAGLRSIIAELRSEVAALNGKVAHLEERLDAANRDRDAHVVERNAARDLARGLWNVAESAGVIHPFPRPPWL